MKLAVTVSPDRLQAVIHLPGGMSLAADEMRALVRDAGVVFGIDKSVLQQALQADDNDRQMIIARGKPAVHAKAGRLKPVDGDDALPRQVAAGQTLGAYSPARRPVDGMGVNGLAIEANQAHPLYDLSHGLTVDDDGQLVSETAGWFYVDGAGNYCADVHGLALQAEAVSVTVAANRSRVSVDIPRGCFVPLVVMRTLVQQHGIQHGLNMEQMRSAAVVADQDRVVVVARATPARDGGDACLAHQVAEHPDFEPDEHGDLDFKGWNSIIQVTSEQVLADLTQATEGVDGCDVLGQPIPAQAGAEVPIDRFLGEGVTVAEDGKRILAAHDGVYRRAPDGKVHVVELVVVDGDIDHHSGSIDTSYAVIVKGDIKEGFRVKSGADIEVQGVIEDARVTAQGNLEVRGGILPGKNRVKAHGSIGCSYARERELKCHDLVVRESVTNCQVLATGSVSVKEIGGGHLMANGNLTCETLGSRIGAETLVHVGIDPFLRSHLEIARKRKMELEGALEPSKELAVASQGHLDRLARQYLAGPRPVLKNKIDEVASGARRALSAYKSMADELAQCSATIEDLEKRLHMEYEDSHVKASKQVHPGVTVRIGPTYYNTVYEELKNADFHL